jgi:deoxyguanosine kinase
LERRYIAIEGPLGVGKTTLAERLSARLDATLVSEDSENPFLGDYYGGRGGAAFQAQLFFTLARHRQLLALRQHDLFSQATVCDFLFERDRIYAFLNLDDNELFIYQRLYELLARDLSPPDQVIYLQAPTDLIMRRLKERARRDGSDLPLPTESYISELNEAYNHFFFHYTASPLLVVETSHVDLAWGEEAVEDLRRQLGSLAGGTRYYVPRTG